MKTHQSKTGSTPKPAQRGEAQEPTLGPEFLSVGISDLECNITLKTYLWEGKPEERTCILTGETFTVHPGSIHYELSLPDGTELFGHDDLSPKLIAAGEAEIKKQLQRKIAIERGNLRWQLHHLVRLERGLSLGILHWSE